MHSQVGQNSSTISLIQQSSNLGAILVWTIDHAHQRQSVSLQPIQDQVKTKSGPKGFLTPHFPSFLSSFSSHNFGTSNFLKGFQADNLCYHKNSLVWIHVLLLRHRSQLKFSSLHLSSLSLVVVVASRQHSCFTLWL